MFQCRLRLVWCVCRTNIISCEASFILDGWIAAFFSFPYKTQFCSVLLSTPDSDFLSSCLSGATSITPVLCCFHDLVTITALEETWGQSCLSFWMTTSVSPVPDTLPLLPQQTTQGPGTLPSQHGQNYGPIMLYHPVCSRQPTRYSICSLWPHQDPVKTLYTPADSRPLWRGADFNKLPFNRLNQPLNL